MEKGTGKIKIHKNTGPIILYKEMEQKKFNHVYNVEHACVPVLVPKGEEKEYIWCVVKAANNYSLHNNIHKKLVIYLRKLWIWFPLDLLDYIWLPTYLRD